MPAIRRASSGALRRSRMDDVKFALVGCGRISRKHVDAIAKVASATLVAVCDLDLARQRDRREARHPVVHGHRRDDRGGSGDRGRERADTDRLPRAACRAARRVQETHRRREADGPQARGRRRDDHGVRPRRRTVVRGQAEPLQPARSAPAQGARGWPVRQARDGHRACSLVPAPGLLRSGRVARHVGSSTEACSPIKRATTSIY